MGVQASSKVDFRALRGFRGFNCFFGFGVSGNLLGGFRWVQGS